MSKQARITAFDKLKEKTILKHVRSVIWVMIAKEDGVSKFVPYYRHTIPHHSICDEVQRRCLQGMQPRTFYIAKACVSESGQQYLANPIEISFSKATMKCPTNPDFDPDYTIANYVKDSYVGISHNKKHLTSDVLAFRCSNEPFDDAEMMKLFTYEKFFI